jgi:hypothetical protein
MPAPFGFTPGDCIAARQPVNNITDVSEGVPNGSWVQASSSKPSEWNDLGAFPANEVVSHGGLLTNDTGLALHAPEMVFDTLMTDFPHSLGPATNESGTAVNVVGSDGVQTQVFSTLGFDQRLSQQIQFSHTTAAASNAMKPSDIMHHWESTLSSDLETRPPLADILSLDGTAWSQLGFSIDTEEMVIDTKDDQVLGPYRDEDSKAGEASSITPEEVSSPNSDLDDPILPCQYGCGKNFLKPYLRNKHHKVHNPPHSCPYCDRRFAVSRDK